MEDKLLNQNGELSQNIGKLLLEYNLRLAVAESCTGGLLSHIITQVPGASGYFMGAVIAYSNKIKTEMLGVKAYTLEKFGAVSAQVANQMAKGIINKFNADIACSVTGIAGPEGGSEHKPVGLVYIAVESNINAVCERFNFSGLRQDIKYQSAVQALNLLYNFINDNYKSR